MRKKYSIQLFLLVLVGLIFFACNKVNAVKEEDNSNLRRIKKSNKVIIDNANRTTKAHADRIAESITYFYNNEGLLRQLNIYVDSSSNATLIAALNVSYFNNAILINNLSTFPPVGLFFVHDNLKRIKSINSISSEDSIKFNYNNQNQVNEIISIDSVGIVKQHFDFVYDANNNLISYKTKDRLNNNLISTVDLAYYPNYTIRNEFDSRFYREETRLFHLGGLNLIYMIGLNYGNTTKNALKQRTERTPNLTGAIRTTVHTFSYEFNSNNEIIYRYLYGPNDTLKYNFEYE